MRFLEYHQTVEDETPEIFWGPANTISAGRGELWEIEFPENRLNEISNSYAVSDLIENNSIQVVELHQNNRRELNPALDSIYLNDNYQRNFVDEEEERSSLFKSFEQRSTKRSSENPKSAGRWILTNNI